MAIKTAVSRYTPTLPSRRSLEDLSEFPEFLVWLDSELSRISSTFTGIDGQISVSHNPPSKLYVGLMRYADGTDWNPGSGEGLYIYKSGGWTFIV